MGEESRRLKASDSLFISDLKVLSFPASRKVLVTIDVARKLEVPKMLLVVNKALPSLNYQKLQQQIQQTYNVPVAGILPVCEEMFQLGSSDIFCSRYPEHPWTKTVSAIASTLIKVDGKYYPRSTSFSNPCGQ